MTTKLTAVEGWAQVFKTIIDECDPQALTEADGYVWRYVQNQRKEIERLRAELEQKKYGFCNGHFTVYGSAEACTHMAGWYNELIEYRRKYAREEELAALKAENERLKQLCREQLIDPRDEGPCPEASR